MDQDKEEHELEFEQEKQQRNLNEGMSFGSKKSLEQMTAK